MPAKKRITPKRKQQPATEVTKKVDKEILAVALALAKGDRGRLVIQPPTVLVVNRP